MTWLSRIAGATLLGGTSISGILVREEEDASRDSSSSSLQPYVMELQNDYDIVYYGTMRAGGQSLRMLMDTGSPEVVVFGDKCTTCGPSARYSPSRSPTFTKGNQTENIKFGGGTVYTKQIYDRLSLGPYVKENMPMWEVHKAEMQALTAGVSFDGILGIGPPGEPLDTASKFLVEVKKKIQLWIQKYGTPVPQELLQTLAKSEDTVRNEAKKQTFFQSIGVNIYSMCLGRRHGSHGTFVINDVNPNGRAGFYRLRNAGRLEWTLGIWDLTLVSPSGQKRVIGCQDSCGAIVDTGTSLLGFASPVFNKLISAMKYVEGNCGHVTSFPALEFLVNGKILRLPPQRWIGETIGSATPELMKLLPKETEAELPLGFDGSHVIQLAGQSSEIRRTEETRKSCQVLAMDLGNKLSDMGPLIILGMPFFREYYTTFDSSVDHRAIHVASADSQCRPYTAQTGFYKQDADTNMAVVNLSAAMPPRINMKDGKVQL